MNQRAIEKVACPLEFLCDSLVRTIAAGLVARHVNFREVFSEMHTSWKHVL